MVVGGIASLWGQEEVVVEEMKRDLGAYSLKSGTSGGKGDVSLTGGGGEKKSRDAI